MPAPLAFENTLPDTKSAKSRGYRFSPSDVLAGGTLAYQHKGHASRYWVERIPSDLAGHAFVFRKVVKAGEEQSVNETLLADLPENDLCSCHGFAAHSRCKHLDVLRDLQAHGQLPAPLVETDADAELCDPDADVSSTEVDAGLDAWCDAMDARPLPPDACMYPPGSEKRRAVEAERVLAGYAAAHPNDLPF